MNTDPTISGVESVSDFGDSAGDISSRWITEIQLAEKEFTAWTQLAKKIIARYRDDKDVKADGFPVPWQRKRYNIFWSNVQTLQPAIYARTPKPVVERRFKDSDPVARMGSEVLERAINYSIKSYGFDEVIKHVRDDYLIVGRGTPWIRYVPHIQTGHQASIQISETIGEDHPAAGGGKQNNYEEVVYEEVLCDYIHWEDFLHSPARIWSEVRWVARKAYLTRDELKERFGYEVGNEVPLDYMPKNLENDDRMSPEHEMFKKACIYEIWDKQSKKVYWISKGYKSGPLDVKPDPLRLKNFFPCPKPLYATTTTDSLVPVPDYKQYQDQAKELDSLTERLSVLIQMMRVAGIYDASFDGIQRLLEEGADNELIPIHDWPGFADKGGMKALMEFLPIAETAAVMAQLYNAREQTKQDLYEITGMSDIIRGSTSPSETATAQQIKSQFSVLRLADRQDEMQRLIRDLMALQGEVISEHFSETTLALISGVPLNTPEEQQMFMASVQLLRNDALRCFKIDIETDSTIALDETQEKESRVEFLSTVGAFLDKTLNTVSAYPEMASVMGEMLMFAARGFKVGRNLESALESTMQNMAMRIQQQQEMAAQQPAPDPMQDPAMMKVMAEQQSKAAELQLDQQRVQIELLKAQNDQAKVVNDAKRIDTEATLKAQEIQQTMQLEVEKLRMELELKRLDMAEKQRNETLEQMRGEEQKQQPVNIALNVVPQKKTFMFTTDQMGNRIAQDVTPETPII